MKHIGNGLKLSFLLLLSGCSTIPEIRTVIQTKYVPVEIPEMLLNPVNIPEIQDGSTNQELLEHVIDLHQLIHQSNADKQSIKELNDENIHIHKPGENEQ